MNIARENLDALNVVLTITFTEEDYAEKVEKALKDYRRKANMPGFRPGQVPMGMIKKMYGKAVLVEEVNKLLSEQLNSYIRDEKLQILGEPLPSDSQQSVIDFDNSTEFSFAFDLGLAPDIKFDFNKELSFNYYEIAPDDAMINKSIQQFADQNGQPLPVDVVESSDNLRGDFAELDSDGNVMENGHTAENVLIALQVVKDQEAIDAFVGANVSQIITIDVAKSFPNEADRAAMLQVEKEALAHLGTKFQFTITSIERFTPHAIDAALFEEAFPGEDIKTEEAFRERMVKLTKEKYVQSSDYKLRIDFKKWALENLSVELPEAFLRRWLKAVNQDNDKLTPEILEKEFPEFIESTKWQLVKDQIFRTAGLDIKAEEMEQEAIAMLASQFAQYGLSVNQIPYESLREFAQKNLQKEEEYRRIWDELFERKAVNWVKEQVSLTVVPKSEEDFAQLFQPEVAEESELVSESAE